MTLERGAENQPGLPRDTSHLTSMAWDTVALSLKPDRLGNPGKQSCQFWVRLGGTLLSPKGATQLSPYPQTPAHPPISSSPLQLGSPQRFTRRVCPHCNPQVTLTIHRIGKGAPPLLRYWSLDRSTETATYSGSMTHPRNQPQLA